MFEIAYQVGPNREHSEWNNIIPYSRIRLEHSHHHQQCEYNQRGVIGELQAEGHRIQHQVYLTGIQYQQITYATIKKMHFNYFDNEESYLCQGFAQEDTCKVFKASPLDAY